MRLMALALTAGLGTRLRPHTLLRAKPAIPFLGVPLGLHALRHLESVVPEQIYLNLHYRPEDIRSLDTAMLKLPTPQYSDEREKILGSAGALNLITRITTADHYLLCNGDEVLLPEDALFLKRAFEHHQKSGNLATLVTMEHSEVGHSLGGAWTDRSNRVEIFSKKPVPGLIGQHYVGYAFLSDKVRGLMKSTLVEENILYETLTLGIAEGERVECFPIKADWFETGETPSFVKSSHQVLDILENRSERIAAVDLRNFLARFASFQFQIETEDAALSQRLQNYLKLNLNRVL